MCVPMLPLPCVYSEMPVQLIRSGKFSGAAWPGAQVGLISYVPPQVSSQMRSFLKNKNTNIAKHL